MRLVYLPILYVFFLSCKEKPKPILEKTNVRNNIDSIQIVEGPLFTKDTLLDYSCFSIIVPMGWRKANDDTVEKVTDATFRVRLHNKNNKLIYFEHGLGGGDPSSDFYVEPIAKREVYKSRQLDTTYVIFSDDPQLYIKLKNKVHKTHGERISGHIAKFFEPVKFGVGYSGVYIDSVDDIAGNRVNFSAYAENLDKLESQELLKAIRTMTLKSCH